MTAWLVALAIDLAFGEAPSELHPVAGAGALIGAVRDRALARRGDELAAGGLLVALPCVAALAAWALARRLPAPLALAACLYLLKSSFALRALVAAGLRVADELDRGDLVAARESVRYLVSRPVGELDRAGVASAAIESLAENLNDSYVAPLLYHRALGAPASLLYRVVNTADAMVGYRGRFERLGKIAARADDALGWLPARASAAALAAAAPVVGLDGRGAWSAAIAQHGRTASPNSGWPMAAAAGALRRTLVKAGHHRLGSGPAPDSADIRAAARLVLAAALVATGAAALLGGRK